MLKSYKKISLFGLLSGMMFMTGCYKVNQKADPENLAKKPEKEYAPQMYHSEAYDPMSQVTDKGAGVQYWPWDSVGTDQKHGEWYNTNYYNPHNMNVRQPAKGSVSREAVYYDIAKDDVDAADALPDDVFNFDTEGGELTAKGKKELKNAEQLYMRYCSHCHGKEADGKGNVPFPGVANLKAGAASKKTASYIYHVITMGKGNMRSHAAQVSHMDRWKIAAYIKELHK